jgi:uncharacterized protein YqiB (DUF1249 family)
MSNVSKQIYRKINNLLPDLQTIKPFTKFDLKARGHEDIHLVVLESTTDEINFILTRYETERGQLIANPSIEVIAYPKNKIANVVTYKDPHYFHHAVSEPDNIGEIALCQANRFLYDWLKGFEKGHNKYNSDNKLPIPKFSRAR